MCLFMFADTCHFCWMQVDAINCQDHFRWRAVTTTPRLMRENGIMAWKWLLESQTSSSKCWVGVGTHSTLTAVCVQHVCMRLKNNELNMVASVHCRPLMSDMFSFINNPWGWQVDPHKVQCEMCLQHRTRSRRSLLLTFYSILSYKIGCRTPTM